MSENVCPQCGAPLPAGSTQCKFCGESVAPQPQPVQQAGYQQQPPVYQQQPPVYQQPVYQQPVYQQQPAYAQPPYVADGINPAWPIKSKIVAGVLGILLGGLGIHKFYLGKVGLGIVYILFCWTGIPELVGFIEGIVYLCSDDHNFQVKNQVRLQ